MIKDAKSRAKRSILIDHCGVEHIDFRSDFHNIEHVYSITKETKRGLSKLSLIEFQTEEEAENIAKRARHDEGLLPVPLKVFRYNGPRSQQPIENQKLPFSVNHVKLSNKRELESSITTYSDLVSHNAMSLVALKMRFITLVNLERILCAGMFSEYELMPFGSSVIDTGCDSGDLDLVVTRKEDHHQLINDSLQNPKRIFRQERIQKLVHLDKSLYSASNSKSAILGTMKWFDYILREYMPLTDGYGVILIPHAKVPIIKFTARITSIDCDLSFNLGLDHSERDIMTTNYSGILMSQIMYSLCRNNNLFTALVVYLRIFGRLAGITSKGTNIGLTNFQFLSLIIFFLQQVPIYRKTLSSPPDSKKEPPIIPPFKELLNHEYIHKPIILLDNQLNSTLPKLIKDFFRFYSNFNFTSSAMDLYDGSIIKKLDNSSVYVVNPLDKSRNICHNVTKKGLDSLVQAIQTASSDLQNTTKTSKHESPLALIRYLLLKRERENMDRKIRHLQVDSTPQHFDGTKGDINAADIRDICMMKED